MDLVIATDDPRADDVRVLLDADLAFAREDTPLCHVYTLDVDGLLDPAVTFFSVRRDGAVVGVGALKQLDDHHAELKSMHVRREARGLGVGRALVVHLLELAAARDYRRISIETGTSEAFAPARALYVGLGFSPCPPFAGYPDSPDSTCMTRSLVDENQ